MNMHDNSYRYINLSKCIVVLLVFIAVTCAACGRFAEADLVPEPVFQTADDLTPVDVPMPSDADLALAYMADNNIFNELMSTSDYDLDHTITYGEYAHLIMKLKSVANLPDMRLCPGDQTDFSMLPPGYQYYDDIIQACSTGWFSTIFLNELDEPMPNQTLQTYIAKLS